MNLTLGTAVTAAVPIPLPAKAAPAAIPAASPKYIWAVAMARAQNRVSVDLLQQSLKVSAAEASGLMSRLVARGVVTAPNAVGLAKATSPLFKASGVAPKTAATASLRSEKTKTELRQLAKRLFSDPDTEPAEGKTNLSEDPPETSPPSDSLKS
ncbi:hypothetical protein J7443_01120 [Tropicibacter sp. R15_0]|uniref:hypothetical protein n=1 Tax=Tropicibacter sp. R15_0 TaxID=2821101 RepID=UPI001ADA8CE4|nr:hypothetical protein [Tropicibacter sp. R15_0]MBO9463817.1 hypothetical protein [Tropicibacter sp. R15_0]